MPDRYGDDRDLDQWPQIPPPNTTPAGDIDAAYAIAHCGFCDDAGMRGLYRCDHVDWAGKAKRGMELVRAALRGCEGQQDKPSAAEPENTSTAATGRVAHIRDRKVTQE